jgi:uncharacterized protein YqeY
MTLKDRITEDMKDAMRAKAADRLSTLRMLLAAIKQREVDERIVLDDAAVVGVVDKLVKQRRDSVTAFAQGGRDDLVAKETAEIAVLEAYLPARLSPDETHAEVQALLVQLAQEMGRPATPADMGRVMAAAKAKLAGRVDMGQLSAAIKSALAQSRR